MVLDINLRVDTVVSGIWTRYVRAAQRCFAGQDEKHCEKVSSKRNTRSRMNGHYRANCATAGDKHLVSGLVT